MREGPAILHRESELWAMLCAQAEEQSLASPALAGDMNQLVLQRSSFSDALTEILLRALLPALPTAQRLRNVFIDVVSSAPSIADDARADLEKLVAVNPACPSLLAGFLSFRGFQAIQLYRVNHQLWKAGQQQLAVLLQNWGALVYSMDIHPAARIGRSVFFDHGMGVVVGSTSVIEDDVNIWHGVTLGSTLTQAGDRHPKVRRNATICAGATILGNIEIGAGSIVAAASVVLKSVEPGTVVAGVPAKVVGVAPSRLHAIDEASKNASMQAQGI